MKKILSFAVLFGLMIALASCGGNTENKTSSTPATTAPTVEPTSVVDTIDSIAITANPNNTTILKGQELDLAGLVVTATYKSGKTEVLDNSKLVISGYDANKPGSQTITVKFEDKSTTFTVSVVENKVEDESIKLPYLPQ